MLLVRAIADTNLLPAADVVGQCRRLEIFFHIVFACLAPSPDHAAQLKKIFMENMKSSNMGEDGHMEQK